MKIQENLNAHTGFILLLEAPLLTADDFQMVRELLQMAFMQGEDVETVLETTMELPYDQGPGYLRLWKDDYRPQFSSKEDHWPDLARQEALLHTGWWVEFGYSDSLSSPHVSPVFVGEPGPHFQFTVWEY